MSEVAVLLARCRALGAIFTPQGDKLRIRAPEPLPEELINELKVAKAQVIAELQSKANYDGDNWSLGRWRKTAIPAWQDILLESIQTKDKKREEYARWMLKGILEDQEYKEEK